MSTIRWGILSTANIGIKKVIPAIQTARSCQVTAICSRNIEAAERAAKELSIPRAHGSYQELLADPELDAVYIPLPNHLHVEWSIRALAAGKHVLCEKPLGLDSGDAERLIRSAAEFPHLKIMEAFMYRHHPQWLKAKKLVQDGAVGNLRTINTFFSYFNDDPANVRNQQDIGGGGLMDIGCYPISLSRFITDLEPVRVMGSVSRDPVFGTDTLSSAIMEFDGVTATFTCSTMISPYQRVLIYGDRGHIEIEIPFNAPPDKPCRLWLMSDKERAEFTFGPCDQYKVQAELFARAIIDDTEVPTPLADGLANMKVIDALLASEKSNSWIILDKN
jgi:predicted dehydrogenase